MNPVREWKLRRRKLAFEEYAFVFIALWLADKEAALAAVMDLFADAKNPKQARAILVLFAEHVEQENRRDRERRQQPGDAQPLAGLQIR